MMRIRQFTRIVALVVGVFGASCYGSGANTSVYVGVAGPGPWYGYPGYGYPGMRGGVVIGHPGYHGRYREDFDNLESLRLLESAMRGESPAK